MNKKDIENIISKIQKENKAYSKKSLLDPMVFSGGVIGRQNEAEQFIRFLLGYKQGFVVPLISVYGRSGAGKSTLVRFVLENLDVEFCFVNLRKAKTVFGCANLILSELGASPIKSAQGINMVVQQIGDVLENILVTKKLNFFIIVLDEADVLFYDKRGKPSDFVYKLTVLEENLRTKGYLLCVVMISNSALYDYDLDDRVRSRIGSSEVFFEPYKKEDVLKILHARAKDAFKIKIDDSILEHCAYLSSLGHGDARRAIDLLRVAAQVASIKGEKISKTHIDMAQDELQQDRIEKVISSASFHFRLVCGALARVTFLTDSEWHSTSTIFKQYSKILPKDTKILSYRRISELLSDLENTGLVISQTGSRGRHGYGTQYKLAVSPEMIGRNVDDKWWKTIVEAKISHLASSSGTTFPAPNSGMLKHLRKTLEETNRMTWENYVGL
ncbi:MAG: AAA family ATPase [Candidatus Nitrosotalea sp.]|nr:AAA family ATPase [Candidatus Nitrosotalea sp.]